MEIIWVLFLITTIICAIKWFGRYISCLAMVYYIKKKGYKLPDDAELKECTEWVVNQMLKDWIKS